MTIAAASEYSPSASFTGEVAARITSDLSFRIGGRIKDRKAEVGERVAAGQVLATLDPTEQQADLRAAQAGVSAAEAKVRQAAATLERQRQLIGPGFTTRREYDLAEADFRSAEASLVSAKAQLGTAQDQLAQAELRAVAPGVLTARRAEAGEVIAASQTVFTLAQDGPRDAVFNVDEGILAREPADTSIRVALVADRSVRRSAALREIAPVVDRANGTVRMKFDIDDPPPEMSLGAPVIGTGQLKPKRMVLLPWVALSAAGARPAVWVVDPASKAVSLKPIEIEAYDGGSILVRNGLDPGATVVLRGQQLLWPGQVVDPVDEDAKS